MSSDVIAFSFVAIRDPKRGNGSPLEGACARGCVTVTIVVTYMINRGLKSVERLNVATVTGQQSNGKV